MLTTPTYMMSHELNHAISVKQLQNKFGLENKIK